MVKLINERGFVKLTDLTTPPPPTIVEFLSAWAREKNVVKRSRIPTEKKVLGAILCSSGYTYRDASKILGDISHVAVHDAYKSVMAAIPPLEKKDRTVTIDENVAYLNTVTECVLWLARDADSGEILAFRCSVTKSPGSCGLLQGRNGEDVGRPRRRVQADVVGVPPPVGLAG